MIDEDIRLVNNIERLSNNKSLRSITDELGINNDDFISVVKNAVYIQDRLKDASEASEASTREIESVIQKIREDADLKEEIKQHYSDYLARYDKKRSDRRRQIVNDLPASDITSRSKRNYLNTQTNYQVKEVYCLKKSMLMNSWAEWLLFKITMTYLLLEMNLIQENRIYKD